MERYLLILFTKMIRFDKFVVIVYEITEVIESVSV